MLQPVRETGIILENMNIIEEVSVITPRQVKELYPVSGLAAETVQLGRREITDLIDGKDNRLLIIVGPCSIHDEEAAYEYARRLKVLRDKYADKFCIIMRVYFEKPRTTVGWDGLILNPDIVGPSNYDKGIKLARKITLHINEIGLPVATEYLDTETPQYIGDLVSWNAVGARSVESTNHRKMSSGLSCPVGIKNSTDGNIQVAINAMLTAREPHTFISINEDGMRRKFRTKGNKYSQLILRGGGGKPNYESDSVMRAFKDLVKQGNLPTKIIVDCSHANSNKQHNLQPVVFKNVIDNRREDKNYPVTGAMIESNLEAGNQPEGPLETLRYGVSITDACLGWSQTEKMLDEAFNSL